MDEATQVLLGAIIIGIMIIGMMFVIGIVGHPDLSRYSECVKYEDKVVRAETKTRLEAIPLVGQKIQGSVMLEDDFVRWLLVSPEAQKFIISSVRGRS